MIRLTHSPDPDTRNLVVAAGGLLLFTISVVNCAWVCDDAFITFRTIDNWFNGYGLRWNTAERVQTFTHPLWLFVVALFHSVVGNIYYAAIVVSVLLSVLTVGLTVYVFGETWLKSLWICVALTLSKAFADFSTSGLENPLHHLLLVSFLVVLLRAVRGRKRSTALFVIAGLLALNRMDSVLLTAPVLVLEAREEGRDGAIRSVLIGFLPLVLWFAFSTIYYGSPLPNTAYAKLYTGGSRLLLLGFGFDYFAHSFGIDPVTLSIVAAGLIVTALERDRRRLAVAAGVVVYTFYLLWIGGDFMSGRFLSSLLVVSVVLICEYKGAKPFPLVPAIGLTILVSLVTPTSPVWARYDDSSSPGDPDGVVDERAHYFKSTGLFKVIGNGGEPPNVTAAGSALRDVPPILDVAYTIGAVGFYAGPYVHIVDRQALADPFLARLPAATGLVWRQGHFTRSLPRGYVETIWHDENRIVSRDLAELYDAVVLLTRGDVWSVDRFSAIVKMGLGLYGDLVEPAPAVEGFDVNEAIASASMADARIAEMIAADTSRTNVLMVLSDHYIARGELGRAAATWGTAEHLASGGERVWRTGASLAAALQQKDQGRLAMKILDVCAPSLPGNRDLQVQHAEVLFSQGVFEEAAGAARRGFSFEDPQVAPLRVIADVMRIKRIPEAEVNYRAILQLDPENEHARTELLAIQSEKGNSTGDSRPWFKRND